MNKKVIVTGANGQVGSELLFLSKHYKDWDWIFASRETLDITDEKEVELFFDTHKPDYFINAAAYTAVDKAEENKETCFNVNKSALEHIINNCNMNDCFLLHISSDYVYNNNPERPLLEEDTTNAEGIYAISKLEGDKMLIQKSAAFTILRTSWVYSSFGNNFVKTMVKLAQTKTELNIVADQIGTPSYARDIAQTLIDMILKIDKSKAKSEFNGVYNFSNDGVTNWAEFAETIFSMIGKKLTVNPISTETYNAPAHRPKWSLMNKNKIIKQFGIKLIPWEVSLEKCLLELNAKKA